MRRKILLFFIPLIAYARAEEQKPLQAGAEELAQADHLYYQNDFSTWYQRIAHPGHKIPKPIPKPILIRTWLIQEVSTAKPEPATTLPPPIILPVPTTEAPLLTPPPKPEPVPVPTRPPTRPPIGRPLIPRPAWVRPIPRPPATTTEVTVTEGSTNQPKYVPDSEPAITPKPQPLPPKPPALKPQPQQPWSQRPNNHLPARPIPRPKPVKEPTWTTPKSQGKEVPTKPTPRPITTYRPPRPTPSRPTPTTPKSPYDPNKDPNHELPANAEYLTGYTCKQYNGYEIYSNECESYVECKNSLAIKYVCPDGLYFNPKIAWPEYPCSYPTEAQCEGRILKQVPQPTSECPRRYGYFPSSGSDCSTYIMCQEGMATQMNCPPGLVFNPETASCDWPINVPNCKPKIFQGFTCPAPPLDEYGQPSDEILKFRYGKSCHEYVACQQGHPRLLSCDAGLLFDEDSQTCVDAAYVTNCEDTIYLL